MAKVTLYQIKEWFKKYSYPTQAQFWDTWDSFWHKDEKIPVKNVSGLQEEFNAVTEGFNAELATKQNSTDNSLTTTNKTVPGAINELRNGISLLHANVNDAMAELEEDLVQAISLETANRTTAIATLDDKKQDKSDEDLQTADKTIVGGINEVKTQVDGKIDGPSSSTDNAIARFDGTTGKFVQDSGVYIDDSGNLVMSKTSSIISTDTTDGADHKRLQLTGGGGVGIYRGAYIELLGNEFPGAEGEVRIFAGDGSTGSTIKFYTGATPEKMQITKEGNVGISTNNPSEKLHVIGNILASQDSASRTKTIANKVRMEYNTSTDTLEFNFI